MGTKILNPAKILALGLLTIFTQVSLAKNLGDFTVDGCSNGGSSYAENMVKQKAIDAAYAECAKAGFKNGECDVQATAYSTGPGDGYKFCARGIATAVGKKMSAEKFVCDLNVPTFRIEEDQGGLFRSAVPRKIFLEGSPRISSEYTDEMAKNFAKARAMYACENSVPPKGLQIGCFPLRTEKGITYDDSGRAFLVYSAFVEGVTGKRVELTESEIRQKKCQKLADCYVSYLGSGNISGETLQILDRLKSINSCR